MSGVIAAAGITAAAGIGSSLLAPKGGGSSTASQTPTTPGWVSEGSMQNYGDITRIANTMPNSYEGDRVANLTPEQQAMIQQLYNRVGSTDAGYDKATGMVNGLSGFNSGQLQSQYLRDANLQPYMNPYTQQIIDPSLKIMDQSRQQALNQIGAQAAQTGAFGGSRQGISEGVTNAQSALQQGQFGANLYSQNFLNAQQQAAGDIGRNWQEQTANMGARQWDANFQSQLANQLANLTSGKQQSFLAGVQPALAGQEASRQINQQELDATKALYEEQRMDPYNRAMMIQQGLKGNAANVGMGSQTTTPTPAGSPLATGLGTASTVAGLFGSLGKGFGLGSTSPNTYSYPSPAQSSMYPELGPMR